MYSEAVIIIGTLIYIKNDNDLGGGGIFDYLIKSTIMLKLYDN